MSEANVERRALKRLVRAAEKVLEGLNARIDAADVHAVPVFDGIADLHDAVGHARAALLKARGSNAGPREGNE